MDFQSCVKFVVLVGSFVGVAVAQPERNLTPEFESAAAEFNVPASILKGIAFVETRWQHIRPETQAESHHNMPPAFGVMALRDDEWFGHSLIRASALIGQSPQVLREDVRANIRGAAALLAKLASQQQPAPDHTDLLTWFDVVARYPGIPQQAIEGSYAARVFQALRDGYSGYGIEIPSHQIDLDRVQQIRQRNYPEESSFSPASDDYGPAVWDPSPNFNSRTGSPITHVIVHDTEGSFDGSVSWLKNPVAQASAHYIFRSADGFLKQLVREADRAWHVSCWNGWTIGIEHEGYVSNPAWFTPIMYRNSALLVQHLTARYNIPRHRLRILGHNVWQSSVLFPQLGWDNCNNHTDPGQFWNWDGYLSLIIRDSTRPQIIRVAPVAAQTNVPVYRNIVVTFDRPMDIFSTQQAFSIFPEAPGVFRWSSDATVLTYDPSANLTPSASYVVNVFSTAKSAGGGILQQPLSLSFTTSSADTSGPQILRSYPANAATGISPGVGFQIRFDEPVQYATFAGRVRLVDVADSNQFIGIGNVTYIDVDDKGLLTFHPAGDLQLGHAYRLRFLPGLRDPLNNSSSVEKRIEFVVQSTAVPQGIVIDAFENNAGLWQQPKLAPGSTGIDTFASSFGIVSNLRRGGTYSGKLAYAFSDSSGGVCRLMPAPISLSSANGWIGAWVMGDNSGNRLEMWLTNSTGGIHIVSLGAIDWFGWKLATVPVTSTLFAFNGIAVRQSNGAEISGALYVDDLQVGVSTGVEERNPLHRTFVLHQNYPNPFNPSTTITLTLERPEFASLKVFNTLGQHVATLVNQPLDAGIHRVEFSGRGSDGKPLPSGVYMYRLQTGAGALLKKMMMVK